MGYVLEEDEVLIKFEDRPGLEIRVAPVPVDVILELTELGGVDLTDPKAATTPENIGRVQMLIEAFGASLISWNLERRDRVTGEVEAIPATPEGFRGRGWPFMLEVMQGWITALGGVEAPLGGGSNSGSPSLEGSLPMAPRSVRRASSRKPASSSTPSKGSAATRSRR